MESGRKAEERVSFETATVHAGLSPSQWVHREVTPPISLVTNFLLRSADEEPLFEYSRDSNPTRAVLEDSLAVLEGARHGLAFSSGMAAVDAVCKAVLRSGDHVVCGEDSYGGSGLLFRSLDASFGVACSFVDTRSLQEIERAVSSHAGGRTLIWIESPTNPTLRLVDIAAVADAFKERDDVVLAVDNTFMSSYLQQPLSLGAHVVMHSLTKFMNGHGDVTMGAVLTNDSRLLHALKGAQVLSGAVPSPLDCFLVRRGLRTLALRMQCHSRNAMAVAEMLQQHPRVARVMYPGLASHPQHDLAVRQAARRGLFSAVVSFHVRSSHAASAALFASRLRLFKLATSLGGADSLVCVPLHMVALAHKDDQRMLARLSIDERLIRLSVGLESLSDLLADLKQALDQVPE